MLYFNQPVLVLFCVLVLAASTTGQGADIDYNCPVPECECATLDTAALADKFQLHCEIPYLSSYLDFTIIQTNHTARLSIECTSAAYGEIQDAAFEHLTELEELTLFNCAINSMGRETFLGLKSLKKLTISAPRLTQVEFNTFEHTPNLEVIHLHNAQISRLPTGIFCGLQKLKILDMWHNKLHSLNEIGFTNSNGLFCTLPSLERLNLTRNEIGHLDSDPLVSLAPNLKVLALEGNNITHVREVLLRNLTRLIYLGLSNNRLTHIPSEALDGLVSLKIILLADNSIQCLQKELFQSTPALQLFDVHGNSLQQECVHSNVFEHVEMLRILDLGQNNLELVTTSLLQNVSQTEGLSMAHNNIHFIEPRSFENLSQLTRLNLSHNELQQFLNVSTNSDTYFPKLTVLDLSFNRLNDASVSVIHIEAFPNLFGITLSHNYLKIFPARFGIFRQLEVLDLSHNNILEIEPSLFNGLNALKMLFLEFNTISHIPALCFHYLQNLEYLYLAFNNIQQIDNNAFASMEHLHTLNLAYNNIRDISTEFSDIPNLKWLNLRGNAIVEILSHSFGNMIEELDLSSNKIDYVQGHTFAAMPSLKSVRLNDNRLTKISKQVFKISPDLVKKPHFYINNNPIFCLCDMDYLQTINEGRLIESSTQNAGYVVDLNHVYCTKFGDPRQSVTRLVDVTEFFCTYEAYCAGGSAWCPCCYDTEVECACRISTCPDGCDCLHDNIWIHDEVLCSYRNFTSVPTIPHHAKIIHLEGNKITTLFKNSFPMNSSAEYLHLNDGKLEQIDHGAFNGLGQLTALNLSNNAITSLPSGTFQGLHKLKSLYLKNNKLVFFAVENMELMSELRTLDLRYNNLQTLDLANFDGENIEKLNALYLSNNNWTCDCILGTAFQRWLLANSYVIVDTQSIKCGYVDDRVILNKTRTVLGGDFNKCRPHTSETIWIFSKALLAATVAMAVIFILIITMVICVYAKRGMIQVWLYSRFGVRIYRVKEDTTKRFDAFISYSSKDERIVVREFLPQLEEGDPPYTLCVHFRDWLIGGGIAASVIDSVNASRRTILLLSQNFVESEWCNYEFKTAHHRVLEEKAGHLIVVLLDDEPPKGLDDELQLYIKTHTYIRYNDPWFWKRLKFALPDVSEEQRIERMQQKQREKEMILEQRRFLEERRQLRQQQYEQKQKELNMV